MLGQSNYYYNYFRARGKSSNNACSSGWSGMQCQTSADIKPRPFLSIARLPGPRYHVWTVPETPTDIWSAIGPLGCCSREATSFASIIASQMEATASLASAHPRTMASPKRGTPLPYALPCRPGDPHIGDTRTFRPADSDAGTSRNDRVQWGPASGGVH